MSAVALASPAPRLRPATRPVQRPRDARLLVVNGRDPPFDVARASWPSLLAPGDLVIANDAATLPASLRVRHAPTGRAMELRLAGHVPPGDDDRPRFVAVAFGAGDWRTPTEQRPAPPPLAAGDRLDAGTISLTVLATLGHPRLLRLRFEVTTAQALAHLARAGRPVQYAYLAQPLAPWDVATPIAAHPVAFEPPSASFALDWDAIGTLAARDVEFATLTHAAGLSSTGDLTLDARLPLPEPYLIPRATADALRRTLARGGRVVAVGTTVVRALEHAAASTRDDAAAGAGAPEHRDWRGERPRFGGGVADQRLGPQSTLRVVDAILSGAHEPGASHYELLRAFADDDALARATAHMLAHGYRTHEFGDAMLVWRTRSPPASPRG